MMLGIWLFMLANKRFTALAIWRPYLAWVTVALFSLTYSLNINESLGELKNEIGYTSIALFSFFVFTRDQFQFRNFLITIVASSVVLTLMALYTYHPELANSYPNHMWDNNAPHGGPGDYSSYFTYTIPLLVYLAWRERHRNWVIPVATLLLPFILLTMIWTHNRMFFLSLAIESVLLMWLITSGRARLLIILTLPVALLIGLTLAAQNTPHENEYSTKEELLISVTTDPRLKIWRCAGEVILSHPLSGTGFGRSMTSKSGLGACVGGGFSEHTHNFLLDTGVQMGVPGIIVLIWLLAAIARQFYQYMNLGNPELRALGILGLIFLASVISKNLTDYFLVRHHHLFFWSVIGMLFGYGESLKRKMTTSNKAHVLKQE